MKPSLLDHLRCPSSGERLELRNAQLDSAGREILTGDLYTPSGRLYSVAEGVPVLLQEELFSEGQRETVESFSEKWKRAPGYREATKHHYLPWYLERYGFHDIEKLSSFLLPKKRILEAGTAHGRDALMYLENSSAEVFAIDISSGISLAYRDLGHLPRLHFVRADLRYPPFEPASFDFIACDQVIHHTPNTKESLERLLRFLEPGGHIAFYVYKVKGPIREFCDDFIRSRTTQMSPQECLEFSEAMTKLGEALSNLKTQITIPVDIPLLGIEKGEFDLQRWIYWNVFKCYWNETIDWNSNVITNFDWYHPLHAHRHTVAEVESWLEEFGLKKVHLSVVESGISVLAEKPHQKASQ